MSLSIPVDDATEWLEADGLGGFASGTTSGVRTRRYHALLLMATTPPTGRMVLVNGLDAWIERPGEPAEYLTRQRYRPGTVAPESGATLVGFADEPWPTWIWRLRDGGTVEQEVLVPRGAAVVTIRWRRRGGDGRGALVVRPFLSGRDTHALHHANPSFRFEARQDGERVTWEPYPGVPAVHALSDGEYLADPQWYRDFQYEEERERGLDFLEDLASPGRFEWSAGTDEAVLLLAGGEEPPAGRAGEVAGRLRRSERARRRRFRSRLERSADAYLVERGTGRSLVAGYPWFTDWGRDTFISLRGLCLATGRLADARSILLEWAGQVSEGMLPNRFVDQGGAAEYNTADASLWYVIAVHDYLRAVEAAGRHVSPSDRRALGAAVRGILEGHIRGTRYGIRADTDGLLAAGEPGFQLTWMDAKIGDWVVTPRSGKPVEIQALWLNALRAAAEFTGEYATLVERGTDVFVRRFWNSDRECLYDVVDVDHVSGALDGAMRPNQILAVGGLPWPLLDGGRARQVVDVVERVLWTPLGLRTLEPGVPGYRPRYEGGVLERDGAYHQGTVWPWLLGPFVEAWVRVRGGAPSVQAEARRRFLDPVLQHLNTAGVGHISEIADADAPHRPRGCPFQAWSVAEALRLDLQVLAGPQVPTLEPERMAVG